MVKAFVADQFKKKKQRIRYQFPNEKISDFLTVMQDWWASIDPSQAKEVPMLAFSELMVQKDVVTKTFEVTSMIKSTIGEKITGTIKYG